MTAADAYTARVDALDALARQLEEQVTQRLAICHAEDDPTRRWWWRLRAAAGRVVGRVAMFMADRRQRRTVAWEVVDAQWWGRWPTPAPLTSAGETLCVDEDDWPEATS